MLSSAFEFTEEQLSMIIDALQFQLVHDEDMCSDCVEDAAALTDLLLQHMSSKANRRQIEETLKGLFETSAPDEN
jgi:hypothetical protein